MYQCPEAGVSSKRRRHAAQLAVLLQAMLMQAQECPAACAVHLAHMPWLIGLCCCAAALLSEPRSASSTIPFNADGRVGQICCPLVGY